MNLVTQIAMALAVVVSLLFSADSISGERERETLESLLLTPVPRREIALGKLARGCHGLAGDAGGGDPISLGAAVGD